MRLNDFLAKRIRALRQQNNFSQNELAEMVRRQWGLKWTQVTVAAIESGRREINLEEFFALRHVLQIPYLELFSGNEDIQICSCTIDTFSIQRFFSNVKDPSVSWKDSPYLRSLTTTFKTTRKLPLLDPKSMAGGPNRALETVMLEARGDAEKKAAYKLKVTPMDIVRASHLLWNCSLSAKRDELAPQVDDTLSRRSLQAKRGIITRRLLAELREKLKRPSLKRRKK